ncbi:MAG: NAD(P)H-dependent oxidoreductase [Betaproteobacteria bacterium]|nr:NAD(P)H-dependent oxidoreductase [Betaproteobacteria bacterium]
MAQAGALTFLGLCGSLREGSYNKAALRAAGELAPPDVRIETFDLAPIPPYNDDVRAQGYPGVVQALRARIMAADAVLFVTPEYNYSVPGVLKNAIDWGSRPPEQPFDGKPAAIIGASGGMLGTARAQYHLRQIGVFLNIHFLNRPEVMIAQAASKFDAQGRLTDEAARKLIGEQLVALAAWVRRLRA